MTLKFTILGCGSSGGVPRPALGWGDCDPKNPKNRRRRTSLLVERRDAGGVTRVLVDTPPDMREQLLDAEVDWLDGVLYTHEHADHTHGIDDLRALFMKQRQRVDVYLDELHGEDDARPFRLLLRIAARQRVSADRDRASADGGSADHHRGEGRPDHGAADPAGAWRHRFATVSASAGWPIPATSAACRRRASRRWPASTSGSSMRCATGRTRAISRSTTRSDWIERIKPRRAILTNLHSDLDYDVLRAQAAAACRAGVRRDDV